MNVTPIAATKPSSPPLEERLELAADVAERLADQRDDADRDQHQEQHHLGERDRLTAAAPLAHQPDRVRGGRRGREQHDRTAPRQPRGSSPSPSHAPRSRITVNAANDSAYSTAATM